MDLDFLNLNIKLNYTKVHKYQVFFLQFLLFSIFNILYDEK
jgi:hypothetical protein